MVKKMLLGLVGKKCGMTRLFTEAGATIPVTVIEVMPNRIVQVKTKDNDGYASVQVTTGTKKPSKINKPLAGHYAKHNVAAGEGLWEFCIEDAAKDLTVGTELKIDQFKIGQIVDVTGVTKGKGFAGVIKRHHFSGGMASHGCSLSHRVPGSIGQRQTPGRVFKGRKLPGHLGAKQRTIQNQEIVKIDNERNLLLVKGGVPGAPGGYVIVKPAIKVGGEGDGA